MGPLYLSDVQKSIFGKPYFSQNEILLKLTYVQCSQCYGAVQVLQEVFGLLSSPLTEAKDFIAKCHFGIFLAIALPVIWLYELSSYEGGDAKPK